MLVLSTRRSPMGSTTNGAGFPVTSRLTTRQPHAATVWSPSVELAESETSYRLRAELPGIRSEDVDITVEDREFVLRGEKRYPYGDHERVSASERWFGSFERRFTLPSHVNVKKVDAKLEAGILTVTLPKADEARPRQIKIKTR